jgi:hypothetical protein
VRGALQAAAAVAVFSGVFVATARAQESQFTSDLRREGEQIRESCNSVNPKALGGCAYTLVSSYPFHLALGSLAPGNGFAFGLAVTERHTPNESWRITWSGDAVGSLGGSYRLGGYTKFIHTPALDIVVNRPGQPAATPRRLKLDTWVIDAFAQGTSLESIAYFGQGPDTTRDQRARFGEQQTILGGSILLPMSGRSWLGALHPALIGGIAARHVDIRSAQPDSGPSIEDLYDDPTAPGLARQDAFIELREGVRLRPSLFNGFLRLNYVALAQQFHTSAASASSFNRWTLDLQHEVPLYRGVTSSGPPRDFNGPNECSVTTDSLDCPPLQRSRNRTGTIGFRVLMIASSTSDGNRVPFYFQPTLGGSDINGERMLAAFDDYRFRGPSLLALRESIEHSLWGPVGVFAEAEQGTVGQRAGDLAFDDLRTSTTVGLTVRAGGFPMMALSFSWGAERHHLIAQMNAGLLGGSSRPSLY